MKLDLKAIEARCEVLDDRMGKIAWTLEGPNHYGLFSVYDGDGNVVSRGVEEQQDFIAHARFDVPALAAEVKRLRAMIGKQRYYTAETTEAIAAERDELQVEAEQLRRELHDEQVRRDEWEKMYKQALLVHGGDEDNDR